MNISVLRLTTAVFFIALASYTAWRSSSVLAFALAERNVAAPTAQATLSPYFDKMETGVQARLDAIASSREMDPVRKIRAVSQLLAHAPLASSSWLDLAMARLAAGSGVEATVASLRLSGVTGPNESAGVTGPNESAVMAGRAFFGLPLWDVLPVDLRSRTTTDLIGGWERFEANDKLVMMLALSTMPEAARRDIAMMLRRSGTANEDITRSLGLAREAAGGPQNSLP